MQVSNKDKVEVIYIIRFTIYPPGDIQHHSTDKGQDQRQLKIIKVDLYTGSQVATPTRHHENAKKIFSYYASDMARAK